VPAQPTYFLHFSHKTDSFLQNVQTFSPSSISNRASRISFTQQTLCQYRSKWSSTPGYSKESTLGDTMDPLSALSIAATVVQFIDYGTRILSKTNQLHKSVDGALDENIELEKASLQLQQFCNEVQGSLSQAEQRSPQGAQAQFDQALEEICVQCVELSKAPSQRA
jgi:hypothetical protein